MSGVDGVEELMEEDLYLVLGVAPTVSARIFLLELTPRPPSVKFKKDIEESH